MLAKNWQRVVFALVMIVLLSLGSVVQANGPGNGRALGRAPGRGGEIGGPQVGGPYEEYWDGRGTDSERCDLIGKDGRTEAGWIHWVFSTKGESTDAKLVLGGTGSGEYAPAHPLQANVWHFWTPYFDLDGLTAKIELNGKPGPGGGLVISEFCPGFVPPPPPPIEPKEDLMVTKTVETSFVREHKWNIDKRVETDNGHLLCTTHALVHLYPDGRGDENVKWIIDVEYKGYVDSAMKVFGEITIKNTGEVDAVITAVEDVLAGMPIAVDCPVSFPYTLPVGGTLVCTYSVDVDHMIEGYNVVTVKTEKDMYMAQAAIVWGEPTMELYKTINVKDVSALRFPNVVVREFGPVMAQDATFMYEEMITWAEFSHLGVGYHWRDNRATIVETGQDVLKWLVMHIAE
jgi:hypothetical protein